MQTQSVKVTKSFIAKISRCGKMNKNILNYGCLRVEYIQQLTAQFEKKFTI